MPLSLSNEVTQALAQLAATLLAASGDPVTAVACWQVSGALHPLLVRLKAGYLF